MTTQHWHIQTLADACNGRIHGDNTMCISSFAIDSRRTTAGDMFIALKTDNNDGHKFVYRAVDNGAVCLLVERVYTDIQVPQIVVDDTLHALTQMGIHARNQFTGTVIAVTGSVGKTSVKDMLMAVLSQYAKTQATVGNLNNHLGVPLSLLAIAQDCTYAVIEMGMSAGGEIRHLTHIARPHIAIVTAVDVAHLEAFNAVLDIAQAKAEIFEGLTGDKIAICNADSQHADILQQAAHRYAGTVYTYGTHGIISQHMPTGGGQSATVHIGDSPVHIQVPTVGTHRLINAMAVLYTVHALGMSVAAAVAALKTHLPSAGRGQMHMYALDKNDKNNDNTCRIHVFDETYNSSPASLQASLQVLIDTPTKNRRIAVIGDMLELGEKSAAMHKGIYTPKIFDAIDMVFLCGQHSYHLYSCIVGKKQVFWCTNIHQLCPLVLRSLQHDDVVLIKGSRGMQMDILLQRIREGTN